MEERVGGSGAPEFVDSTGEDGAGDEGAGCGVRVGVVGEAEDGEGGL